MENFDDFIGRDHDGDGSARRSSADPTDDLTRVIRALCAARDASRREIDPDDVLKEIEEKHPLALLRRGSALARKACRRLITNHLRLISAADPEHDGPQIALPGLERIASHTSYRVPVPGAPDKFKVVARHVRDATRAQHVDCLALKRENSQRCIAREREEQKIIDLLDEYACDTLREWEDRFGRDAA